MVFAVSLFPWCVLVLAETARVWDLSGVRGGFRDFGSAVERLFSIAAPGLIVASSL